MSLPHTEQWDWWVMRTGRPVSTHLPRLPLPPFVYDVAQDTVAPGHNMYFLFQSLWPLNSADCHTGHESPESLKLLTDPQMAGRLLRKLPSWGIGKPSSRVSGIVRPTEHPQTKQQVNHTSTAGQESLMACIPCLGGWQGGCLIPSGLLVPMKKSCCQARYSGTS